MQSCILCPVEAGAFKQTTSNSWAHLLCAIWIPEVAVANSIYMEPVDGIEHIPKGRWKLNCYLCHKKVGACIQCAKKTCFTAFHPSCAREYGLSLQFNRADFYAEQAPDLKAFCHKHIPVRIHQHCRQIVADDGRTDSRTGRRRRNRLKPTASCSSSSFLSETQTLTVTSFQRTSTKETESRQDFPRLQQDFRIFWTACCSSSHL